MSRIDRDSPDPRLITHALEKLRARDGLTAARLLSGQAGDARALLDLRAVVRYTAVNEVELPDAAVAVIKECVQELPSAYRIVADAVLGLGVFVETYASSGLDDRVVKALSSDLLGRRRTALLTHWRELHTAANLRAAEVPSDRSLRGTVEPEMLAALAEQLIRREAFSLGAKDAPVSRSAPAAPDRSGGKVVVVGGAVMDVKFRTTGLPTVNTSTEALGFELVPGGKGLNQAVAAARLGLDVALVAAVPTDRFGNEIVDHLEEHGVDTSLLKRVEDTRTPFTAVIEFELGDGVALYWKNKLNVRLEPRDIDLLAGRLRSSDALLVTFEVPRRTLDSILTSASGGQPYRPIVIVSPGQPYGTPISGQTLSQIDYLVAHEWELGQYAPPNQPYFDLDKAARPLLAYGVETLCVPSNGGCHIYSERLGSFSVPTFPSQYRETASARDAFAAGLAAKLLDQDRRFSEEVALWATAAMAAATADHPAPNPMPTRSRVDQLLGRSRFKINPRVEPLSDGGEASPPPG